MLTARNAEPRSTSQQPAPRSDRQTSTPAPPADSNSGSSDGDQDERKRQKEIELAEAPEIFREIFGNCEFPPAQVRKLLAAVAVTVVQDFFKEPERQKDEKARRRLEAARADAERYIFDPTYLPHGDAFAFETVCRALGIDPDFARRGLRGRTPAQIKVIRRRVSFHDFDLSDDDDRD